MSPDADIVVVGAGPWGLATAWLALEDGARVTVLDDGATPAGHVAAGMLGARTEVAEDETDMLGLLLAAARDWPGFAGRLAAASGGDPGLRRTGAIVVAARRDHVALVRRHREILAARDVPVEWIGAEDLRGREPGLGPATIGGMAFPEEDQVEPRALLAALRGAVLARGGDLVEAAGAGLLRRAGAVRGVRDASGHDHPAGCVVLAGGHGAAAMHPVVPLRPVKGQILRLRAVAGAPVPIARTVRTPDVYLAPRDDEVVVGATAEERSDAHATATAVHGLLDEALHTVPELGEMALAEVATGLRPAAPDGRPVIGADDAGVVWAAGGYRNGIALTPVAARLAADLAAGRTPPGWARDLSPERFTGSSACASS